MRNEARVHSGTSSTSGCRPSRSPPRRDAVDHFASTTCCYAVTRETDGELTVYAPHGYEDLFAQHVRPNPRLAPQEVYETKAARWLQQWPGLTIDPWP